MENTDCSKEHREHNYSDPVEMHYEDGSATYPYAVISCNQCGDIVSTKL